MSTQPAYVDAFVAARQKHFDTRIQELVSEAVAQRSRDELDALVAAGVDQQLAPVVDALNAERQRVLELVAQLDNMESTLVEPLRVERDSLAQRLEEAVAQHREAEATLADSDAASELKDAREREAVLAARCAELTTQLNAALEQTAAAQFSVVTLNNTIQSLETRLSEVESHAETKIFQASLDITCALSTAQHELDESQLNLAIATQQAEERQLTVESLRADNERLQNALAASEAQVRQLTGQLTSLTARLSDATESSASAGLHSPLLDTDIHSARRQLLDFWRDGHATIHELKVKIDKMAEAENVHKAQATTAAEIIQQRSRLLQSITTLTGEVEALQEENRRLRTTVIGVEQEAEALQQHLGVALQGHMTPEDIAACATQFRDAAIKSAAHDEATRSDPTAIKQAMQQVQSLKHELSELEKQKATNASTIARQEKTIALLTAREGTARVAAQGFSSEVVAQVASVLRPLGVEDDKLKRLEDLRRVRESQTRTASLQGHLQTLEGELEGVRAELAAAQEDAARNQSRLEGAVSHYRDQLRVANVQLASYKARVAASTVTGSSTSAVLEHSASVCRAVTEICASTLVSLSRAKVDLLKARAETETLRRGQQAAINEALNALSDDAVCNHLRLHLDAMKVELRRRERREHADEAAERAAIVAELQARSASLREATQRVRELGETAAASDAAAGESKAWCASVEASLARLSREVDEAVRTASQLGTTLGSDIVNALAASSGSKPGADSVDEDDVSNVFGMSSALFDAVTDALTAADQLTGS